MPTTSKKVKFVKFGVKKNNLATLLPFYNAWLTFYELRHKGVFCDVVSKDHDVRFPVHRLVLCACSDYLGKRIKRMFYKRKS